MADHLTENAGAKTKVSSAFKCVDLSCSDIHQSAARVKQACMDSEIFYVINHGISEELMNETFTQSKKFFGLPLKEKMTFKNEIYNRGYHLANFVVDSETNLQGQGEGFCMVDELPKDDPKSEKPLYGTNIWPSADVFPGWKETTLRYEQEALGLGQKIMRIIALVLYLNIDFFDQPEFLGNAPLYLTLNYYGVNAPSKKHILGLPGHTDPALITILATDGASGLQICKDGNAKPRSWDDVPPLKVLIGDMLERLSNHVFSSTLHRVLSCETRYSIAFLLFPNHDAIIECLPNCKSKENPPKYPPIKCEDLVTSTYKHLVGRRM